MSHTASMSLSPREWLKATRPWSFTAAAIPIVFGSGLAALQGHWNTSLFVLTLLGGIALQAATNLHNTYGDFVAGVDTPDSAHTCPQLVRGQTSPRVMFAAGWLLFAFASCIGLILTFLCGAFVLFFGLVGLAGGYYYTNGPRPYKYSALGPYLVFFLMGPLMALPAYMIQSGHFALAPLAGSLSIACLVAAIMHANDMRDIAHDRAAGIRTLAMQLGLTKATHLYIALNLAAFAWLLLCVAVGLLPLACLAAFAALPLFLAEMRAIQRPGYDVRPLEGQAAKLHLAFGLSLGLGLLAACVLQRIYA